MVHIAGKRYQFRPEKYTTVKVYANSNTVSLYVDGKLQERKEGYRVFKFRVQLKEQTQVKVVAGGLEDEAVFSFTPSPVKAYKLNKKTAGGGNWT